MNDIDILKILLIRLSSPHVFIKQAAAQSIADLLAESEDDKELKETFIDWLSSQFIDVDSLLGLGIVNIVNKTVARYFSSKEISSAIICPNALSEKYLCNIFPDYKSKIPRNYLKFIQPNLKIEREGFKLLNLENMIHELSARVPHILDQWKNEFNFLYSKVTTENVSYYYDINLKEYAFTINKLSCSAFLRVLNWLINKVNVDNNTLDWNVMYANPINIDLLNLASTKFSKHIVEAIINEDVGLLFKDIQVPVNACFSCKIDDNNYAKYEYIMFLDRDSSSTIEDIISEIESSSSFHFNISYDANVIDEQPGNINRIFSIASSPCMAFMQFHIIDTGIRIPNKSLFSYDKINVTREKMVFSMKEKEIGSFIYSIQKMDKYDKYPVGSNIYSSTFIDKDLIDNLQYKKLGIFLKKTHYQRVEYKNVFSEKEENKILYIE